MADDKKGMLRHVDMLGRVVIPREVRKAMRINYGDLMEFCACSNQQVIMRKFHLIQEIGDVACEIIKLVKINNKCEIYIVDTEQLISKNGEKAKQNELISPELQTILEKRKEVEKVEKVKITDTISIDTEIFIQPIIANGDLMGGVIVMSKNLTELNKKLAKSISNFLINYFLSY